MESNEIIREQIFEVIKNQLKDNKPPETKIAYDRLRKEGFDDYETRQMLGQCVAVEIYEILKFKKSFDNERYINSSKGAGKDSNLNDAPIKIQRAIPDLAEAIEKHFKNTGSFYFYCQA